MLAGVAAAWLVGVEDGEGSRQTRKVGQLLRQMVVGNDEVESQAGGGFGGGEIAYAGVDADDQAYALARGCGEHLRLHAVAFAQPVGHVEIHLAAEHLDGRLEQHDGRGAIHVIVAIDEDVLPPGDGRLNPGDGRGHALHGVRIKQVFDARDEGRNQPRPRCARRVPPAARPR